MYIDEQSKMDLNGVPQFISIRTEKENAPLLIYLHGGPGKSYYKFDGPITIDVFLNDLNTLVKNLLSRFHQNSLYLIGHSWCPAGHCATHELPCCDKRETHGIYCVENAKREHMVC